MKISIITVVRNNKNTIRCAINSVLSQTYENIEYIIIDGASTDGTLEVVKKFENKISKLISEPDNGIYDALNKGIYNSSGDVIAMLHSDDEFCNRHAVSDMVEHMKKTKSELCFSDMVIVNKTSGKVLRYYMAHYFNKWMFRIGWMPPHPTCFINKALFEEFGLYTNKYKIAGDFDFLVRVFYGRTIRWSYFEKILVKMNQGGVSNSLYSSKKLIYKEINHSLKLNGVWSLPVFQLVRYLIRLIELLAKPKSGNFE